MREVRKSRQWACTEQSLCSKNFATFCDRCRRNITYSPLSKIYNLMKKADLELPEMLCFQLRLTHTPGWPTSLLYGCPTMWQSSHPLTLFMLSFCEQMGGLICCPISPCLFSQYAIAQYSSQQAFLQVMRGHYNTEAESLVTQRGVLGPVAYSSPGSSIEMQSIRLYLRPVGSEYAC